MSAASVASRIRFRLDAIKEGDLEGIGISPGLCREIVNALDSADRELVFTRALRDGALAGEAALRKPLTRALVSLEAAISLLENGGKKAAASDKMFAIMLDDYRKALEAGRRALASAQAGARP